MTLYGYARVSVREPEDKNLDLQVERLVRAGCSMGNIRAEEASGAKDDRGGLLELLDLVVEGDTLVLTHIDRLSRGLTYGLQVIEGLHHSLTIVEFHNALAANWRGTHSTCVEYDQAWVERSQVKVMELLAKSRLILRPVPGRADEHAIALVTLATRDYGNGFHVWDAIHLITSAAWARELQATVELWTTDTDFVRFVDLFPEFKRFVQIRNLDD